MYIGISFQNLQLFGLKSYALGSACKDNKQLGLFVPNVFYPALKKEGSGLFHHLLSGPIKLTLNGAFLFGVICSLFLAIIPSDNPSSLID